VLSRGSEPETREVRVHAIEYRWQKSIGRIARLARRGAARLRGGTSRALAGRKLEAPPDAGHGWREGEPVRGTSRLQTSLRDVSVSGCQSSLVHETTEGALGQSSVSPLPAGRHGVLDFEVKQWRSRPARDTSRTRPAHRATQRSTRACLGSDDESIRDATHVSVKAPRGPRRPEGSSHPRR